MFRQKQITWVLWRGTNLSKHDTGQERPLTVIMMCRLLLDGGPWWPHQEGALKPLYHDSTLMDVQVAEGQRRWRLESWRRGEDEGWYEVHWGLYTIVNTYKCCPLAVSTEPEVTLACTKKLSFGQAISEAEWRPCVLNFESRCLVMIRSQYETDCWWLNHYKVVYDIKIFIKVRCVIQSWWYTQNKDIIMVWKMKPAVGPSLFSCFL